MREEDLNLHLLRIYTGSQPTDVGNGIFRELNKVAAKQGQDEFYLNDSQTPTTATSPLMCVCVCVCSSLSLSLSLGNTGSNNE